VPFAIRTPRLLLRDFSARDFEPLDAYRREPLYHRYVPALAEGGPATGELLDRFMRWQEEEPRSRFQLAIERSSSGGLIGSVGLRRRTPGARVGDIGFELAPSFWGQGYATEAALAIVEYGFHQLGMHRLHAHCIAENEPSARVLTRIGMKREGVFRDHEFFSDRWWDVHWYAILATEWTPGWPPDRPEPIFS
jgi:RimJ/RimL family protein N-acetyltransferase